MNGWRGIAWTFALVFFVTIAAGFLNAGGDVFHMSASTWQQLVNAAIAAVLAFAVNWATPYITRYGIGSKSGG